MSAVGLALEGDLRHDSTPTMQRLQPHSPQLPESPYRSPGRAPVVSAGGMPGWAVFFIDGCLVMVIAVTVVTVGRWTSLVDGVARRFLGF